MRAGTAFLVTLALLLGVGVAADALVTRRAEEEASARASEVLEAPARVTLHGWPVALRLVAGRLPEVHVAASDVPVDAVTLARLDVRLFDVRLRLADLEEASAVSLRGEHGLWVAELGPEEVARLAGLPGEVRLGDGTGQLRLAGQAVDVAVSLEDGAVVLRPIGSAPAGVGPVLVPLPALPGAATVEDVRIVRGVLRVSGRVVELTAARG